jgi:receptor expression-enhancing protein 5/6
MPLPPQAQKFVNDVDKKLHEPNAVTNVLAQMEAKTGVRRLVIVGVVVAIQALYLIFGNSAELVCNSIGFLYPAYMSMKAIETHHPEDDTQWLTYWVVFAVFNIIEFFSDTITAYIPVYWLAKCIFLLYLYLPTTMGAQFIYHRFIQPLVQKHSQRVDQRLTGAAHKAVDSAHRAYEEHVKPN